MEKVIKEHGFVAILAGGSGTRLFPLSHPDCPKQFCQLDSENTFIQATVRRFLDVGFKPQRVIIITTNKTQTRLATEQLLPLGVLSQNIREIDPGVGYAGAMILAAYMISCFDPEAVILNTPADQYIVSDDEFKNSVMLAMKNASEGNPTIVGVKVNDLVTVRGCGHAVYNNDGSDEMLRKVVSFVEKPSKKVADQLMREDKSACNTGINCWRAETIKSKFQNDSSWSMGTDELMEKLGEVYVTVSNFRWYDCGTLKSLYEISEKTPNHKNANLGLTGKNVIDRKDCRRSLFVTIPGVDLFATNIHDAAIAINEIDGKIVIVGVQFDHSQTVRTIADDFAKYHDILSEDFSMGARNNRVVRTNMSDLEVVGFVGVENYTISAIRYASGRVVVIASCDEKTV